MQVITPTPSQAAFVLKNYLKELGIDLKLGQMQEAVARMQGYASWNALASEQDPRAGDKQPGSVLRQTAPDKFTLVGDGRTAAFVTIGPVTARLKCEDESVVVDLLATADLARTDFTPTVASAYAHFSEVEDEQPLAVGERSPEERYALYRQVVKELLGADYVLDTMDRPRSDPHHLIYKAETRLLEALNMEIPDDGILDEERDFRAFEYVNEEGRHRVFALSHLVGVEPDGKGGWVMPEEGVAVRFLRGTSLEDRKPRTTKDLLKELLRAARISLFYPGGAAAEDMAVDYVAETLVNDYLGGRKGLDVDANVVRYTISGNDTWQLSLQDLIGAHRQADGVWLLTSGLKLRTHTARN